MTSPLLPVGGLIPFVWRFDLKFQGGDGSFWIPNHDAGTVDAVIDCFRFSRGVLGFSKETQIMVTAETFGVQGTR